VFTEHPRVFESHLTQVLVVVGLSPADVTVVDVKP